MRIITRFEGDALDKLRTRLLSLEDQSAMAAALNAAGSEIRKQTIDAETRQTGLKHDTIERAQVAQPASAGRLAFNIRSKGGNVRLKYFGARETGSGVTADPWDAPHFYPQAFINSGWKDRRPSPKLNGQVYKRVGRKSMPIVQEKSGLFIPTEMTKGATAQAFEQTSRRALLEIITRLLAV